MGILDGVLEKKTCAICGKEISFLGNKKTEDGNMCKVCASKLSPWFRGRKKATIEEIKEQLEYRKKNKEALKDFTPTVTLGGKYKILIDEPAKTFIVTSSANWRDQNPDLIGLDAVRACDIEVKDNKKEVFAKDANGDSVSYDPPRYEYDYEFRVHLNIKSPYYPSIEFEITDVRPKYIESEEYHRCVYEAKRIQAYLLPGTYAMPDMTFMPGNLTNDWNATTVTANAVSSASADAWKCECGTVNTGNFCSHCGHARPQSARWFCPSCGTENFGNFCTKCGKTRP